MTDTAINLSRLPPQLRKLVACIGFSETIALLKAKGGQQIKISGYLTEFISAESVAKLREAFGERVELPKYDKIAQQLRNLEIIEQRQSQSANQLAGIHGLSRRMIIYISQAGKASQNEDLFKQE